MTDKEELYKEINSEIEEKGLEAGIPDFSEVMGVCSVSGSDFSSDNFSSLVSDMDRTYFIHPSVPLKGNPIVVFIKKVIRKLTRFYVEPAFNSQTEFNGNTLRAMRMLEVYHAENAGTSLSELNGKIELISLKLKNCTAEIERLGEKVKALETENEELRKNAK